MEKKKQEGRFKVHCIVDTTTAHFRMPAKTRERLLRIENNISHNSAVLESIHTDYNIVTS